MKKEKLNWIYRNLLVIVALLFITGSLFAQELNKTIEKTTNIANNIRIFSGNTSSKLLVKTWDKKQLKVIYNLQIKAKSNDDIKAFETELESILNEEFKGPYEKSINVSFPYKNYTHNRNKITLRFQKGKKRHELTEFKLDVVIYAPKGNPLSLTSSFGQLVIEGERADVSLILNSSEFSMGDCNNLTLHSNFCKNMKVGNVEEAELKVSSGDLNLNEIKGNLVLKASFSNIEISKIGGRADLKLSSSTFKTSDIKELELDGSFIRRFVANNVGKAKISRLSSSEFRANKIKFLTIDNSSFSTFRIAQVENLSLIKSSSSKFYITAANIVEATSCSFTDFSINKLKTSFVTRSSSGSIELNSVAAGFDKIKIDGSFVNIDIGVEENSNYKIKAELDFPNYRFKDVNFSNRNKGLSHESLSGYKGTDKNASSEISFDCKSCSITLN